MAKKQKCYLYTRVSTQMQVEGYSLEAQHERLLKEAKHRDMEVAAEFSDEGRSGKNVTGRPEFLKMLRQIQDGNPDQVSYVYVFKLSRFGRNAADVLSNLQLMEDCGVNLLAVEDGIDSAGAAGKLMIAVLAAVAEIERENINAQTMAGRWQKAREGKWNGGQAPYGYRIGTKAEDKDGVLVINEDEAPLIRMIFEQYAGTGMGIDGVAKWLNANGYRKRTRENGIYSRIATSFVKNVLDNPVYAGKIAYGRRRNEKINGTRNEFHVVKQNQYELYDGCHEAIVSDDLWQKTRAKRILNNFKREKTHSLEHVHILSGIVRCPVCGGPMYGVVNRKKKKGSEEYYKDLWYYFCNNRRLQRGTACTFSRQIRQEELDSQVRVVVQSALRSMDFTQRMTRKIGSSQDMDALNAELDALRESRKKVERQKTKLLDKIAGLDPDDALYDSLYENLQDVLRQHVESISEIDGSIERVSLAIHNAASKAMTAEQVRTVMQMFVDMVDIMPAEDEKRIMDILLERVDIYPDPMPNGLILKRVRFKVPLSSDHIVSTDVGINLNGDTFLSQENHDDTVVQLSLKTVTPEILVAVK